MAGQPKVAGAVVKSVRPVGKDGNLYDEVWTEESAEDEGVGMKVEEGREEEEGRGDEGEEEVEEMGEDVPEESLGRGEAEKMSVRKARIT